MFFPSTLLTRFIKPYNNSLQVAKKRNHVSPLSSSAAAVPNSYRCFFRYFVIAALIANQISIVEACRVLTDTEAKIWSEYDVAKQKMNILKLIDKSDRIAIATVTHMKDASIKARESLDASGNLTGDFVTDGAVFEVSTNLLGNGPASLELDWESLDIISCLREGYMTALQGIETGGDYIIYLAGNNLLRAAHVERTHHDDVTFESEIQIVKDMARAEKEDD